MTSRALVIMAGALGCAPRVELPDVPIVGGTPEARRAARAELERFDAWVGAGRLWIREVRFEDLDGQVEDLDVNGRWLSNRDLVLIESDLPYHDVADVVRHELCHALDSAEDLSDGRPVFDRLGLAYPRLDWGNGKGLRREAFAEVCDTGPLGAAVALSASCQSDDPDLVAAFGLVAEEVWTGEVTLDPGPPVDEQLGGFPLADATLPVESWLVMPTSHPDRLAINLSVTTRGVASVEVDLVTGQRVAVEHEPESSVHDPPAGLSLGEPMIWYDVGWPDGPAAAAVTFPVRNQSLLAPRVVVHDGEQWRPVVDTCAGEGGVDFGLFTARDQIWYAWDDGEAIYWAPLSGV